MKSISALCLALALCVTAPRFSQAQGKEDEATKIARSGSEAAKSGDWDKAVEEFRKAAEKDHKWNANLVAALQQRGAGYMKDQKWAEAAADFSEALKINPRDAGVHERRAYVEMKSNQYDQALEDYNEAIQINPHEARYYNFRAFIYETKGDVKNSMADTDHALKIDKDNAEAKARKERLEKILKIQANQQANQVGATPIPAPSGQPKKK
jgi:tetratricopeptide (TPR) repeat protein